MQDWHCELLRVLNRGESVNSLKRSIYVGRVAGYQAKQHDEMQAVADALSLLANLVMAWNTMKMQLVLDRWNTRRSTTRAAQSHCPEAQVMELVRTGGERYGAEVRRGGQHPSV
jgi:TnpA family transposase